MTLEEKANEYAEKECKNCSYRCDKPNLFKRLSNKKECHAYFRSYEGYLAGIKEGLKMKVNTTTISDAPLMDREQLEQAKEFLEKFCSYYMYDCYATRKDYDAFEELKKQAEQFLKEIEQ